MIEVDRYQSIDIDYPEDLIFANTVFNGLNSKEYEGFNGNSSD